MVKVNLPFGYPIVQGQEFETVVFQKNLVRSYTLPTDPRSDSQTFNRRFLADVSKMRGTLGVWGKQAMKECLGSSWSTVIFQLIKSDSFSWWSDATAEWETFTENNQQAWRDNSPFQVTFNDMGWIFFSLCRVFYRALEKYHYGHWDSALWTETQSAAALTWWNKPKSGVESGVIQRDNANMRYKGTWENYSTQYKKMTNTDPAGAQVIFIGRQIWLYYLVGPDLGIGYFKIGTDEPIEINTYSGGYGGTYLQFDLPKKRFGGATWYPKPGHKIGIRYIGIDSFMP